MRLPVNLLVEFLEHRGMEKEPDSVREEEIGLRCENYYFEEVLLVAGAFEVALQVKGAELRNEELEIVPEHAFEVGIDSTLLKILDGTLLMCVHPHHRLRHQQRCILFRPLI